MAAAARVADTPTIPGEHRGLQLPRAGPCGSGAASLAEREMQPAAVTHTSMSAANVSNDSEAGRVAHTSPAN